MLTAGIAKLKASLSDYLARVKAGEEVLVTERGRPIARLTAIRPAGKGRTNVEDLVRRGIVRPPFHPIGAAFWRMARAKDRGSSVLKALLAEREEGR